MSAAASELIAAKPPVAPVPKPIAPARGPDRPQDLEFDLRQGTPSVGQVWKFTTKATVKDADYIRTPPTGEPHSLKMDMMFDVEFEVSLMRMEAGALTQCSYRVQKAETTTTLHDPGIRKTTNVETSDLTGCLIIATKSHGEWEYKIDGTPSERQLAALAEWAPLEEIDKGIDKGIPERKLKIGATWELDATHLKQVFGATVSGKAKCAFTGIRTEGDDFVAVIETDLATKEKLMPSSDSREPIDFLFGFSPHMRQTGKLTTFISLKYGIPVRDEGVLDYKFRVKEIVEEQEVDVEGRGKMMLLSTWQLLRTVAVK